MRQGELRGGRFRGKGGEARTGECRAQEGGKYSSICTLSSATCELKALSITNVLPWQEKERWPEAQRSEAWGSA